MLDKINSFFNKTNSRNSVSMSFSTFVSFKIKQIIGISGGGTGRPDQSGRGDRSTARAGQATDSSALLWQPHPERDCKSIAYYTGTDLPAGT